MGLVVGLVAAMVMTLGLVVMPPAATAGHLGGAVLAVPVQAQLGNAQLSVLHGVPGLTVDVYVNGERTLDDFTPGTLAGPLDLPAGTYTVAITAADAADASSPAIGSVALPLEAGKNYTAVAHLDAAAKPTATLFTNDTAAAPAGQGKVTVRHTAANAEGVEIVANGSTSLGTFNNGQELGPVALPAGTISAEIRAGGAAMPPTPADVPVTEGQNTIVYAWGDASTGAVEIAVQTVALGQSAPANDAFDAAAVLAGVSGSVAGSNVGATLQDEPGQWNSGASVWFQFTPPVSGDLEVNTFGSGFDTVLGVYWRSDFDTWSYKAENDDAAGILQSAVRADVVGGATYLIRVAGYGSDPWTEVGEFLLTWMIIPEAPAPLNDPFASPGELTGLSGGIFASTEGATIEVGEPLHNGWEPEGSVWYQITPPVSGTLTVDVGSPSQSPHSTVVYRGTSIDSLVAVSYHRPRAWAVVEAGTTYRIAVTSSNYAGLSGFSLRFWVTAGGVPLPLSDGAGAVSSAGVDHVFVRGMDDAVWTRNRGLVPDAGWSWTGWSTLGGVVTAAPAAVSRLPKQVDVFVRGGDNGLWTRHFNGVGWGNWVSLGGILNTSPSVVSSTPGTVDVFAAGCDGALWTRHFDGGSWGGWRSLGGAVSSTLAAASMADGTLDLFMHGADAALWTRRFDGTTWTDWASLGGSINSAPSATSRVYWTEAGEVAVLDVYARGGDNAVWCRTFVGSTLTEWGTLGGAITSPPVTATNWGSNTVFARGQDGALWMIDGDPGYYLEPWHSLGGQMR